MSTEERPPRDTVLRKREVLDRTDLTAIKGRLRLGDRLVVDWRVAGEGDEWETWNGTVVTKTDLVVSVRFDEDQADADEDHEVVRDFPNAALDYAAVKVFPKKTTMPGTVEIRLSQSPAVRLSQIVAAEDPQRRSPSITDSDLAELLRERSKYFSTTSISKTEAFSTSQVMALAKELPEYRVRQDDPAIKEIKRAFAALADMAILHRHTDVDALISAVATSFISTNKFISPQMAASLVAVLEIKTASSGGVDWRKAVLFEVALITNMTIDQKVSARIPVFRICHPDSATFLDVPLLRGIPVKAESHDRQAHKANAQPSGQPTNLGFCKKCGAAWTKGHKCMTPPAQQATRTTPLN
jgi:hypothetical protein